MNGANGCIFLVRDDNDELRPCGDKVNSKGLCLRHYHWARRHPGEPLEEPLDESREPLHTRVLPDALAWLDERGTTRSESAREIIENAWRAAQRQPGRRNRHPPK